MNKKSKDLLLILLTAVIVVTTVFSIKNTAKEQTATFLDYFDTVTDITIIAKGDKPLNDCEDYIKKMDKELSADSEDGLISQYNKGENVEFSKDAIELIDFSKTFSSENKEYFSVYLDPLIKAWDIKNNKGTIPDVSQMLEKCKKEDTLNLGGVAKGFVTEKLVEILKKAADRC